VNGIWSSFHRSEPYKFRNLQENSMIPETKKEAVARALREAFGMTEFEDIQTMTAGLSPALVFRIVVRQRPFLLRIVTNTDAAAGPGRGDQTHHYACMKHAAEAGIGPRVWYTSTEDRISITDFVQARPFPRTEALAKLPATIRILHALPPFPFPRVVNYFDAMDGFVRKFQAAKILPESETEELFQGYARVANFYPRHDSDLVSSHNDLKPENILFDGDRVWLVDWEAGFLNDRYHDLAVVANFVVTDDAEAEAYLRTYFEEAPGEYRLARLYLMGQLLHMFYPAVLMLLSLAGTPIPSPVPSDENAQDFRDFHDRIWAGEVSLDTDRAKLQYARLHMNQFLRNIRTVRFREALRIVSGRHAGA
jgi:aminoglycoside phosphotransferase (APT) family kinase protein